MSCTSSAMLFGVHKELWNEIFLPLHCLANHLYKLEIVAQFKLYFYKGCFPGVIRLK